MLGKTKKIIYPSELFFFLYVSLNLPYPESSTGQAVAQLCASNLAKHIKKITASFGVDYFLALPFLDFQFNQAQIKWLLVLVAPNYLGCGYRHIVR